MKHEDKLAVAHIVVLAVVLTAIWWWPLATLATGWKVLLTFIALMAHGLVSGLGKARPTDQTQVGEKPSHEREISAPHGLRVGAPVKYNDPTQGWVEGTIRSLSSTDSGTAGLVIIELADGTTLNLPPEWLVAGIARREVLLSEPGEVDIQRKEPAAFEFGEGTKILQFAPGHEECYGNHLRLIEELKARNAYPDRVNVFGLKSSRPGSSPSRLIVVTGPLDQWQEVVGIYNTPEADAIVGEQFGGNWMAINASSNLSSVPDPGCSISDPRPFRDRSSEIERGDWIVERRIR